MHIQIRLCVPRWRHSRMLNLKIRSNLRFLAPQGRRIAPVNAKFGTEDQCVNAIWECVHTLLKIAVTGGPESKNSVKFAVSRCSGATWCTDHGEIWHGRAPYSFNLASRIFADPLREPQNLKMGSKLQFTTSWGRFGAPILVKFAMHGRTTGMRTEAVNLKMLLLTIWGI